jgi:NitT/TauT family transport system ATP-binding protein
LTSDTLALYFCCARVAGATARDALQIGRSIMPHGGSSCLGTQAPDLVCAVSASKPPVAKFDHVSLSFDTPNGTLKVLDDVSYEISEGEFVSIIGPSGCGKTTMLNMLAGFQTPTTGSVTFDGRPISGPGPERGVIFQDYGVFPWLTVRDNIAFGLKLKANHVSIKERHDICDHYLALMGLSDFANSYPKHLSGGMRQRLAIARAYAVKPKFLLMDEPFGALDAQTRSNMQNLLLQVLSTEGKTVMLITHSVDEAIYLSSRIIVVTARPARIKRIIDVKFPYPRQEAIQELPEFGEIRKTVRELVMSEYQAQQAQRVVPFSE